MMSQQYQDLNDLDTSNEYEVINNDDVFIMLD